MVAEEKGYTGIAALLRQPEYEVHSFNSIMILWLLFYCDISLVPF